VAEEQTNIFKFAEGHLEKIRKAEFDVIRKWIKPGSRILEIGGGSGYQAHLISALGCEISSIDIPSRQPVPKVYYPVQDYDGKNIPFPDRSFDIVFSSNALEHIQDLPSILAEVRRVLRPDGICIHILPSATWRLWTGLAHYLYILKYLFGLRTHFAGDSDVLSTKQLLRKRSLRYIIKRAIFPGPHGEYPSAYSELYYYRRTRWIRVFREGGFTTIHLLRNGIFCTGYGLLPSIPMKMREKASTLLGSSCNIFILSASNDEGKRIKKELNSY
jgi:ubiquinone/menaquinone biosynthesis C-methylase UbiE